MNSGLAATSLMKATDYSQPENWYACPNEATHAVDVIYFCATTYHPCDTDAPLVCSIDEPSIHQGAKYQFNAKASVFLESCNVYMPFYRQLDCMRFVDADEIDIISSISWEPRTDVFAALDYYFSNINHGRPFILAGHSQGSLLLRLVLDEYMLAHREVYKRMVAAYLLGYSITYEFLQNNPHLKFAKAADDVGVVISWNTEGPANSEHRSFVVTEGAISINPLNWKRDNTYASVEENLGSAFCDEDDEIQIVAGMADAQVDRSRGVVVCHSAQEAKYAFVKSQAFGPVSYHSWDYGFYYMNIRQNVAVRIAKFFELHSRELNII